jgi:hypothetical protein
VVDEMYAILSKANLAEHIVGVAPHLILGVTHFYYAGNTMILIQTTYLGLTNIKFFLVCV